VRDLILEPGGSDLVLMGQLCHALDRGALPALLAEAGRALAPGGALLIGDQVLNRDRTGPPQRLLFGLKLLVGTRGEVLSWPEYAALLRAAGFTEAVLLDQANLDLGLIVATRDRPPPWPAAGRDRGWRPRRLLGRG